MTTLSSKLHDVTKQLQQLTVWRPNEHDPFIELHRWRNTAHQCIEDLYHNKRQEIENLIEKHQREFMRQIARQRTLIDSLRQRLANLDNTDAQLRIQTETSIFTDLQKIQQNISTKLGRGEIHVYTKPIDSNDLVTVRLKTYLANHSTLPQDPLFDRPAHQSTEKAKLSHEAWLRTKTPKKESVEAKRRAQSQAEEEKQRRLVQREQRFHNWLQRKKESGAFRKKQPIHDATSVLVEA